MSENIREITLDALLLLETENKKSHLLIRDILDKYDYLDSRDKAFFKRLTEGTISSRITLDHVINRYSSKPVEKCKPVIRAVLRMTVYQILFMEKVPDSAAINEGVKLVKKRSFEGLVPFVNGVLRTVSREKDTCLDFSDISDNSLRLSVKYSCPEWIVKMFLKEQKNTEDLLLGLSRIRPTCVKIVDPSERDGLIKEWASKGIVYTESRIVKDAFLLTDFEGIDAVPGFNEGKLIIQDESSMIAALATGIGTGDDLTVIDTCAAPGGKTSFTASLMSPKGKVISCDVSDTKVSLISENVSRLKLNNVTPALQDATVFNEDFFEKADVVITDVPCSGLGVMARKSDIKYNISNEAMKEICDLQKKIVMNVAQYVKPGGILIYSTCTIHRAENEKMVKYILDNLPFEKDSLKPFVPKLFETEREDDSYLQLLPNIDGTDGFFVARLRKRS